MVGNVRTRAVVLDDHPGSLRAIAQATRGSGIAIVAVTSDPAIALEAVPRADVAILSVDGREGLDVLRDALAVNPELVALALGHAHTPEAAERAYAAGAAALVARSAPPHVFASALRRVLERELPPEPGPPETASTALTQRELVVLRLVADGRSNGDVARTLWVTEQTVKFHLTRIYRKLGVTNRTAAARWAHRLAAEEPEPPRR
ncbi:MAG TPA: response regulator transcription factor [Gaiellaceae bacterium]|nr:response regulator transcription factor [Gaiellaceae bacterium]